MKPYLLSIIKARHTVPVGLIVLGVVFANSLYIFGVLDANPVPQRTDLRIGSTAAWAGGRNTIDPNDGFTAQALGHLAAKDWLSGSVPYWNHYEGVGTPLAGEMQSASFLPISPLLSLSNGLLYFHVVLEIIAGIATYLLLIKLRFSWQISGFGGLAFALNGTFAWLTNAVFNPVAFLPVLLLGIEMAYLAARTGKKRGWLLIAAGMVFSVYAGFPETAYLDGLLALVWAAARLFQLPDRQLRKLFMRKLVAGGLVGILLATPVLTAFYGYFKYADVGTHAHAYTFGIVPIGLSNLFMPYIFGPIFSLFSYDASGQLLTFWSRVGGYITASLLVLAIFGLAGQRERILKRFLAGWVLVSGLGIYGLLRMLYVLNLIPGIKSTMFYRYAVPSFEMAIIILAAFGLSELAGGRITKKTRTAVAVIMTVILSAGIINALPELHRLTGAPHHLRWAIFSVVLAVFSVAMIFAAQLIQAKKHRQYVLIGLATAEVLALFMIPQLSTPHHQQIDIRPVSYLQNHLGQYRFFTLSPIQPNYGSYYKIASININDVPVPKTYSHYITQKLNNNVDPLVFVGDQMTNPRGLTPLQAFTGNFAAYQELGVKYLVAPPGLVPGNIVAEKKMRQVFASPAAVIFELPKPKPYFEVTYGSCTLTPDSKDALIAVCKQSAVLLRREQFMPGWTATANGRSIAVRPSGPLFQSIQLPAGRSRITYYYAPPHIYVAYAAVVVGLGVIAASYINPFVKSRAPNRP